MVTSTLEEIEIHRAHVANCSTFQEFKEAQLQYLDACVAKLLEEDEKLKDAAREILGLNG